MLSWLAKLLGRQPRYRRGPPPSPRLILTEVCIAALRDCLEPEIHMGHEGIAYLLGQSDGTTTLAVSAIRPEAQTTRGSFAVTAPAMAQVVRAATNLGLQVVGQVHTHPGQAYHSAGDETGARIAYTGYVSMVLPDYGRRLPALSGTAAYIFQAGQSFVTIEPSRITIAPARVP